MSDEVERDRAGSPVRSPPEAPPPAETPLERRARRLGMLFQILLLGQLLVIALGGLYAATAGARVFRYAGF